MSKVVPYKTDNSGKKEQVAKMFNNISAKYDFLNHFLSMGIDIYWRNRAIKLLKPYSPKYLLDIATGTADLAITSLSLNPTKVVGVDISEGMLDIGRKKIEKKSLTHIIELTYGDSENLPFPDNNFDAVMVAFGVRNFENLEKGISEIFRVLKPGGVLMVLEFSKPRTFPFKQLYNFYFKHILPIIGRLISKDTAAYTYLPESVNAFPDGDQFTKIMSKLGFTNSRWIPLTFGISSIYLGEKK